MAPEPDDPAGVWNDALHAADLFAADPHGLGGIVLRAGTGPVRDLWLGHLRDRLTGPVRRMPPGIADDRLIGGLDLPATLRAGRPVIQRGLLAEADGGVVVVPMAERLERSTVARLAGALDTGLLALERDGLAARLPARFGLVLLDEGQEDETVAEALADRMALRLDLSGVSLRDARTAPSFPPAKRRKRRANPRPTRLPPSAPSRRPSASPRCGRRFSPCGSPGSSPGRPAATSRARPT